MPSIAATGIPRKLCARIAVGLTAAVLMLSCAVGRAEPQEEFEKASIAYRNGDVSGAMEMIRAPADAGHAPSQALLGMILESAGMFEESVAYFRKSAAQGDVEGEFGLASALASGRGVERDLPEARRLYELAAGRDHRQSIELMAELVMRGGLGLEPKPRPDARSLEWVRKAAEHNYLPSLDYLARGYRDGSVGAVDVKLAQEFEARAEKLRYPNGRPRVRRR